MSRNKPAAINTDHHRAVYEAFGYGPGAIASGYFAYVSGQIGINADQTVPSDPKEQIELAYSNLTAVMSDLPGQPKPRDIVDITTFNTNMREHFSVTSKATADFFGDWKPAWTALGVSELAVPGLVFEVRAIVRIPDQC